MPKLFNLAGNLIVLDAGLLCLDSTDVAPTCSPQFKQGQFVSGQFKMCGSTTQTPQFKTGQFKSNQFK